MEGTQGGGKGEGITSAMGDRQIHVLAALTEGKKV